MSNCPRCGNPLDAPLPQVDEVWLRVDTRKLYVVTRDAGSTAYATAERLHPRGPQGCDPEYMCAMWRDAVRRGEWIKVEGMPAPSGCKAGDP